MHITPKRQIQKIQILHTLEFCALQDCRLSPIFPASLLPTDGTHQDIFWFTKKGNISGHYILISHSVKRKIALTNFQTRDLEKYTVGTE